MFGFGKKEEPQGKKVTERKKKNIKKRISRAQAKKLAKEAKKGWGQAKAQLASETNTEYTSLYYPCGNHNVNAYTPWQHDEICGG